MKLIVVESPTKAKTIGKYLSGDYIVLSSMGHVRELPPKDGSVDTDHDFKLKYQIKAKAIQSINKIVSAAKKSDQIFLASDPDREGEAISWHIKQIILDKKAAKESSIHRVSFTEITPVSVKNAIANPRAIDENLVDAQQARVAVDYLFGFNVSPVLWHKLPTTKSAGRVQSVAVALISEREIAIKNFVPEEYWTLALELKLSKNMIIVANVISFEGKKFSVSFPKNESIATSIKKRILDSGDSFVASIANKDFKQNPYPPFITSTLQQDALHKLGFTSARTMRIAQRLYEGVDIGESTKGLITYMRTDGTSISAGFLSEIRNYIGSSFGKEYLPEKAIHYKTKVRNAQEAHEAIRVTDVTLTPNSIAQYLEKDELRLYSLIWKRTVACQMMPALKSTETITFHVKGVDAIATLSATKTKFPGFLAVYNDPNLVGDDIEEHDSEMPKLENGQEFKINDVLSKQHFTSPPARYNEASLIKKMEELGVGRPSTYSLIISVIQERDYVSLDKRQFHATPKGIVANAFLRQFFNKYIQYDFTAKLETDLDEISNGKMYRLSFLKSWWDPFISNVNSVMEIQNQDINKKLGEELVDYIFPKKDGLVDCKCALCKDGVMEFHTGKFGPYIRCSTYPACSNTIGIEKCMDSAGISSGITVHSGDHVFSLKSGQYGKYVEVITDGIKKNISIPSSIGTLDEDMIIKIGSLPRVLGIDEKTGKPVIASVGRFGPYVSSNSVFASIKTDVLFSIDMSTALTLIERKVDYISSKATSLTANGKSKTSSKKSIANKSNKLASSVNPNVFEQNCDPSDPLAIPDSEFIEKQPVKTLRSKTLMKKSTKKTSVKSKPRPVKK